jgi:hypothetical protein
MLLFMQIQNLIASLSQLIMPAPSYSNASEEETEFLNSQTEILLNKVKDYGKTISHNQLEISMMVHFSILK